MAMTDQTHEKDIMERLELKVRPIVKILFWWKNYIKKRFWFHGIQY
jgi:hypothetical protein